MAIDPLPFFHGRCAMGDSHCQQRMEKSWDGEIDPKDPGHEMFGCVPAKWGNFLEKLRLLVENHHAAEDADVGAEEFALPGSSTCFRASEFTGRCSNTDGYDLVKICQPPILDDTR